MVKPCSPFIDHNKGNPTANQRAELSYRDLLLTQGIHESMGAMGSPGEAEGNPLEQYTNNSMAQLQNTNKMAASKLTNPTTETNTGQWMRQNGCGLQGDRTK